MTEKDVVPHRGTLANFDATPGLNNCSELDKFSVCMHALFRKTPSYERRRDDCIENVFEWQLWLLSNQWRDLRKVQHGSVKNATED